MVLAAILAGEQSDRCSVKRVWWTQTYKSGQLSWSLWRHPPAVFISVSIGKWGRCSSTWRNVKLMFVLYIESELLVQSYFRFITYGDSHVKYDVWTKCKRILNPYSAPLWQTLD